jgi:hydroxypyruvate isomerase
MNLWTGRSDGSQSDGEREGLGRRDLLRWAAAGAVAAAVVGAVRSAMAQEAKPEPVKPAAPLKGRLKQCACKWCFGGIAMDPFAKACAEMGLRGVEMVGPGDWPILKKYGLLCPTIGAHGIGKGLNRKENHDEVCAAIQRTLEQAAANGIPNVICFSGNREGLADQVGAENCVEGLKKVAAAAEQAKVTLVMELLNSKRDHKDYQCDRTAWGVEVVRKVGSPRVKLLYDIYHMQIMEGDVIATLRENIQAIGHIHTGGVPGRHEIDDTQELFYPAIMKALVDLKYDGYVGHEFVPKRDPLTSLRQAVQLCDV